MTAAGRTVRLEAPPASVTGASAGASMWLAQRQPSTTQARCYFQLPDVRRNVLRRDVLRRDVGGGSDATQLDPHHVRHPGRGQQGPTRSVSSCVLVRSREILQTPRS